MSVYLHDWSDSKLEGLKDDFSITDKDLEGVEILLASYTYKNYSGDAFVLFRKDGKLYEVNGSHCSCCGLSEQSYSGKTTDTQWQPEETTKEALLHRITEGSFGHDRYSGNEFAAELKTVLDSL